MKKTKRFDSKLFKAMAVLIGTVVGAGIFGLPYAISKVGIVPGIIYIVVVGLAVIGINLMYSEIVIRTQGKHRMSGYAKKYLGRTGQMVITASLILGIYGGLLAYTIGVGNFLYGVFGPMLGGSAVLYSVIFWALASLAIFRGLGVIASLELVMVEALIFIVIFVSGISFFKVNPVNWGYTDMTQFFYPFGVVLFALGGATAIPTMREILGRRRREDLKKASVWGLAIPMVLYIVFSLAVIGVSGIATSEQAVDGLAPFLGNWVVVVGGIFGTIAMATSFMALGHVLRQMYVEDYDFPAVLASFLVILVPLLIFFLGMQSFVQVIGISGSLLSGFQGLIIILMYYRCKKRGQKLTLYRTHIPLWVGFLMCLLFVFGIVYQVYYLF